MRNAAGKYFLSLIIAGLTTGALDQRPLPVPLDQEEYLDAQDWLEAGLSLSGEERYGDAEEAFARSLSIEPDNPLSWLNLGTAQALLGNYPRAIESLKESVRLNPTLALGFSNLAEVCFRMDRFQEAAQAYSALLELWPGNTQAIYKLGLSYLFLNEVEKARLQYLSLKNLDPELANKLLESINQGGVTGK